MKINAFGLVCPIPLIKTKKALQLHDIVETEVDNEIAMENIIKMAKELGFDNKVETVSKNHYIVTIMKKNNV